mgnify:CR=1 FL=1
MGIGQRYGVMVKRGTHSGKHIVRASTRTAQLYQGTAILDYDMPYMVRSSIILSYWKLILNNQIKPAGLSGDG